MNKCILLLLCMLLLAGCNKKFSDIFYRKDNTLVVNEVYFDYLSAKAKIDFESDKNNVSGVANVRIKKDSVIWMSLSPGLGIEVARVMITHDSVSIIDKINKAFIQMSFAQVSEKLDFDVDYGMVESVILGNLIYPYKRESLVKSSKAFTYNQQHGNFHFENIIGSSTYKLEKVVVEDTSTNNEITVTYSDFQLVEEEVMPFNIQAEVSYANDSKKKTEIEIAYKQTQIEKKELKFPFNVPQRYERK